MPAYLKNMPAGVPGMISRDSATVEPQLLDSSNQPTAFGVPVAIDGTSKKLRAIKAGDTAANVYGFVVRDYPSQSAFNDFGPAAPPSSGIVDVMRRGYIVAKMNAGMASNGGTVYVRVAAPAGAKVIGGIEAASDTTNTIAVPNATFTGAADADGSVEISFNI